MCADFEQEDNYYLLDFVEDYNGRYIKFMNVCIWDDNGGYYETYDDHKKLEEHLVKSIKERKQFWLLQDFYYFIINTDRTR